MSDVADFNLHFLSQFSSRAFLVAGRIYDLAPDRFDFLACEWYARHGFIELPNDRYIGQLPNGRDTVRYHSVDSLLLENPQTLSAMGQHLYDNWLGIKAKLNKQRTEPPVVILPPPPEPPKAKPIELPPKEEPKAKPKKPRPEWVVKLSVYLTIATPVVLMISLLLPPPWNMIAKAVFEALKVIFNFGG